MQSRSILLRLEAGVACEHGDMISILEINGIGGKNGDITVKHGIQRVRFKTGGNTHHPEPQLVIIRLVAKKTSTAVGMMRA